MGDRAAPPRRSRHLPGVRRRGPRAPLEAAVRGVRHWETPVRRGIRRDALVGQLADIAELLRGRHPPHIARRLYHVLAEFAEIVASTCYDAGLQPTAQHYYVYALRATHAAREPFLGGSVLGAMARQMLDLKRPDDALDLTRLALDGIGRSAPGQLRAMLRTREAWAYVVAGRVQAVLERGGRFEVILPASDYREAKVKPHNLQAFDELLEQATAVHYMPFETSGREAYMAASEALVARSDRLLAVWDGQPSGGLGGTADVVEHARREGLSVEVIWPNGARRR